jgi:iron-sulfur cluster assembly accessory protein
MMNSSCCSTNASANTITMTLTPSAVAEIKSRATTPGQGLRLSVGQGGCSGKSYELGIATAEANDLMYSQDGVCVYVDPKAVNEKGQNYYEGIQLDYSNDLTRAGFRITNPNAQRTCGCGTSFEAN